MVDTSNFLQPLKVAKMKMHGSLENLNILACFNSHPTQELRKTMLDLTNHIHALLRQHQDVKAGLMNENKWYNNLRCNINHDTSSYDS